MAEQSKILDPQAEIKTLWLNICMGTNTFDKSGYTPMERLPELLKIIEDSNPAIIALGEFRKHEATNELLKELINMGYHYTIFKNNGTENSMGILVGWKPSRVIHLNSKAQWHSDTPDVPSGPGWFTIAIVSTFARVSDGKKFTFCATHFPLRLNDKISAAKHMKEFLSKIEGGIIVVGDFNTFGDNEEELRQSKDFMRPLTEDSELLTSWAPTWRGFPFDKPPPEGEKGSALDHALASNISATAEILDVNNEATDHDGIIVRIF